MRRIRDAVVSSWLPEQKTLGRASRKPSECWTRVDIFVCPSNACQYRNTTGTLEQHDNDSMGTAANG